MSSTQHQPAPHDCESCGWRSAHVELQLPGAKPFALCVLCVPDDLKPQAVPLPAAADWVALALAGASPAGTPS